MSNENKQFIHPQTHHIWCDGSFRPPNNASCAYVIFSEKTKHIVKMSRWGFRGRTINMMELEAINKALDESKSDYVIIYSDSQYAISCLTLWRHTWVKRDWKTPLGDLVKNRELIEEIAIKLDSRKFARFVKIESHSGIPFNTVVDFLAQDLTKKMRHDPLLPDGEYKL